MKKKLSLGILILSLLFSNCKKTDIKKAHQQTDHLTSLLRQGFDTTGIKEMDNYYLLEGDMIIYKSDLTKTAQRQVSGGSARLVNPSKQTNITVRIDPSLYNNGAYFDWSAEVSQAIAEYNSLTSSNIRFTLVTTLSADITIKAEGIVDPWGNPETGTVAEAPLPSSGNPGSFLRINTNYVGTLYNSTQKKYILMHEMGHCIGFQHTDPNGRIGVVEVIGSSPNSGSNPDSYSLMNSGSLNLLTGFSNWDKYSISYLYPAPTVSVEFKNTGSQYVSGALNFNSTFYFSYSGTVTSPYSSTYTSMLPATYQITASLAPGWDPYYVSIGGGTPKYISSYGGTAIGTYYVGSGFIVNVWR